jgi:aminoglycoside phosphotransferase (APT) family kinase protein
VRSDTNSETGPDVFRLAQAHRTQDAVLALERTLRVSVVGIQRSAVGSSHAVYLVDLEDGRRCAVRFATHAEHRLAQEVWASERCRQSGLPVPRLLGADFAPPDYSPPFAVYEYLPGVAGDSLSLTTDERAAVLAEMSRIAARIHRLTVPGTGELAPRGSVLGGISASWAEYVQATLERRIGQLSTATLPDDMAVLIRQRFETTRPALDAALPAGAPASALVHGDFRLQNALLTREADNRIRINAVLDFEMVLAGDGAVDLAWLDYQDGRSEADLVAIVEGYGAAAGDSSLRRRLRLYQLSYALEHLWWLEGFADLPGIAGVHARIRRLLATA